MKNALAIHSKHKLIYLIGAGCLFFLYTAPGGLASTRSFASSAKILSTDDVVSKASVDIEASQDFELIIAHLAHEKVCYHSNTSLPKFFIVLKDSSIIACNSPRSPPYSLS
ncbi:MAG: hypothetical protein ISR65_20230 [Bacteriovoracaceae bacterium]|nr:hypothetical protein [Bacteriovoracaceae bacterium]